MTQRHPRANDAPRILFEEGARLILRSAIDRRAADHVFSADFAHEALWCNDRDLTGFHVFFCDYVPHTAIGMAAAVTAMTNRAATNSSVGHISHPHLIDLERMKSPHYWLRLVFLSSFARLIRY